MTDPDGVPEKPLRREPRIIAPNPAPGAAPEPEMAPEEAAVDRLVDETGATIEVSPEKTVVAGGPAVGATGPTNWWRIGLIAVAIVAAILFAMQFLAAGPADTDAPSPGEPAAVDGTPG